MATTIIPTAAVAVSNDVLKPPKQFYLLYITDSFTFVSINTIYKNLCTRLFDRRITKDH